MIFGLFNSEKKTITRNELRVMVSRQCGNQDFIPLDMEYTLVPSRNWLIRNTPSFSCCSKDCNKRACLTMANMQSHCVGMCIVATKEPMIDHCLMLVCMENKNMMLYDPSLKTLKSPKGHHIKRVWL